MSKRILLVLLLLPLFVFSEENIQTKPILGARLPTSRVPAGLQAAQNAFQEKCIQCHALRIATNSPSTLPSYWSATINRMSTMPNAGLSGSDVNMIYEYMVYDSATRRKRKLERELQGLTEGERAQEQQSINQVLNRYK